MQTVTIIIIAVNSAYEQNWPVFRVFFIRQNSSHVWSQVDTPLVGFALRLWLLFHKPGSSILAVKIGQGNLERWGMVTYIWLKGLVESYYQLISIVYILNYIWLSSWNHGCISLDAAFKYLRTRLTAWLSCFLTSWSSIGTTTYE